MAEAEDRPNWEELTDQIDTTYDEFKAYCEEEEDVTGNLYDREKRRLFVIDTGDHEYTISTTLLEDNQYDVNDTSEADPEKGELYLYEKREKRRDKCILVEINETYDERGARNVDSVMRRRVRPEDLETALEDAFAAVTERITYESDDTE